MRRAGSENATRAQLMYDEAENRLGIRLYDESDESQHASIRDVSPEKSGIAINLLPLLRYYGLPEPKKVGKRVLPITVEGKVIAVDLKALREKEPEGGKHSPALRPPVVAPPRPSPAAAPARSAPSPARPAQAVEEFDDDIPF